MAWPPRTVQGGNRYGRDYLIPFGTGAYKDTKDPREAFMAPGFKNPAIEQLPASTEGIVTVDGSGVTIQSDNCRIFTGTYTGDGVISQIITLPGAVSTTTVRYLRIWMRQTTDNTSLAIWESTREINDDITGGAGVQPSYISAGTSTTGISFAKSDTIIALGTDGTFTVDDRGSDYHPNKNGTIYNYLALGSPT